MNRILGNTTFHPATTVTVEASMKTIGALGLDTFEGEQYDRIRNVLSVAFQLDGVHIETTRSTEAWQRGEPNAGRGTYVFPHDTIEAVYS